MNLLYFLIGLCFGFLLIAAAVFVFAGNRFLGYIKIMREEPKSTPYMFLDLDIHPESLRHGRYYLVKIDAKSDSHNEQSL